MNHLRDIQETISQQAYHTHTQMTSRVCLGAEPATKVQQTLGVSKHQRDGTP